MTIRSEMDIAELKARVEWLEKRLIGEAMTGEQELVTVARQEWNAVLARLEQLERRKRV